MGGQEDLGNAKQVHLDLEDPILPLDLVVALVTGLGRLNFDEVKTLALKAGGILLILWVIAITLVVLLPLSFPQWESAAFFSASSIETPPKVNSAANAIR